MPRISITQLAADLGVSAMSVSVALRGRPGVSDALRRRIIERAGQLGYCPDPVAAELMAIVRSKQRAKGAETIAFINTFADPVLFERIPGFSDFLVGAQKRATEFGYRVEQFNARKPGLKGGRLAGILKARGVRGVLVGPRWRTEPDIDFPWQDFSVVLVGEAEYGQNLYRVCNHHVHSCATTLQALAKRGYRRIGLALVRDDELKRGYDYLLGVEQFRLMAPTGVRVEKWIYDSFNEAEFKGWVGRRKLDAVVTLQVDPARLVPRLRALGGEPVGYANLSIPDGVTWSGINQHTQQIGAAGVDLLRSLLLTGERGTAPQPRILLVEGNWVDGTTTAMPTNRR